MNKLQKFANPTISNTTYAGEAASGYIAAALLSATTLDNKLVTIMPNVKYKSVIQKLAVANLVNDASCDFVTNTGSVTISEQILTPKELQVNIQLCKQEFVASWEALQLGFSAFDEIPKSFNDYLVSYVGGVVAQATEESIWQGNNSTNGQFGGFELAFSASVAAGGATAVLPARTSGGSSAIISGSVTPDNVIAKLNGVFLTVPKAVYGKQDLLMYVSTNVAKSYQAALAGGGASGLGANGFNNQLNVGEKPMNFNGVEIVMCPGMSDNKIVAAQKSNLFFGTGLLSDYNQVKVIDLADIDGSQNYRIIMRYTAGTQFGIGQDIVYYGAY
ncbi:MAG: hypothetical protein EBR30_30285 [Cytophagia bacterium]|nr:hypothetical protein [Cytophagia bacterium]